MIVQVCDYNSRLKECERIPDAKGDSESRSALRGLRPTRTMGSLQQGSIFIKETMTHKYSHKSRRYMTKADLWPESIT
jgi:hypothetical protein